MTNIASQIRPLSGGAVCSGMVALNHRNNHYAKSRPSHKTILYLAFNRSVREEAERRFAKEGLRNVRVETAHSLAYYYIVRGSGYLIRNQGYQPWELASIVGIRQTSEVLGEFIMANHVNKFASYYCNSAVEHLSDLDYKKVVIDFQARLYVEKHYEEIRAYTEKFIEMMNSGSIEITHDFYLKKFQQLSPQLRFDYILFDEGQDASAAMLDVFLKQRGTKVIVGDTHQQVYGWRYAINSLEEVNFRRLELTGSFRFGNDIARLAEEVLRWKRHLGIETNQRIQGYGKKSEGNTKAIIARTNIALLMKAIENIREDDDVDHIYFEGHLSSYLYGDEGASLMDVLHLYLEKRQKIRDRLILQMDDLDMLKDYAEKTENHQLMMMIDIVKKYGAEIPELLKELKLRHLKKEDRHRAEKYFSTVHRCKGMEYDEVELVQDFRSENDIQQMLILKDEEYRLNIQKEEVNLLYVGITRAKRSLRIPSLYVRSGLEGSSISLIASKSENGRIEKEIKGDRDKEAERGWKNVKNIKDCFHGMYRIRGEEDLEKVRNLRKGGKTDIEISIMLGCGVGEVRGVE